MARLSAVLDTNVLVSGVAYPRSIPGRILSIWHQGGLEVVLSRYILNEMIRVLPRVLKVPMTPTALREVADSFLFQANVVEQDDDIDLELRDPADQAVLGTLRASQAQYLITGDKDLLALSGRYSILTPAEFWARHGG